MRDCGFLDSCHLRIQLLGVSPKLAGEYEEAYCKVEPSQCARHMVAEALGREKVPLNMLPFETAKARYIIEESRRWAGN